MSREEFTELIYYISQLKTQYNRKLDEQSDKINEQNAVIEELLWQLRELSDKVRQLTDNVKILETKLDENSPNSHHTDKNDDKFDSRCYENLNGRKQMKNTVQIRANKNKTDDICDNDKINDDDIYETIEFSDSSTHIYTEPVKSTLEKSSNKTKKVTAKITTTESAVQHMKMTNNNNEENNNNVVVERRKGIEPSGFRSYLHEDYETESDADDNVTLRRNGCKSAPANKNKKSPSRVLVSDIETAFIPGMSDLTDADFIHIPLQQLTVSDILIDFSKRQRNEDGEKYLSC